MTVRDEFPLTTREVMALTGATERQLQYWGDTGLTNPVVRRTGSNRSRFYDAIQLRRAQAIYALSRTSGPCSLRPNAPGARKLGVLKRIPDARFESRWLLFTPRLKLLAATDDRAVVIRLAAAAGHGVLLVELPAFVSERAGAAHA